MKKKSTSKKSPARTSFAPLLPAAVRAGLRQAESYIRAGEAEAAVEVLAEVETRNPGHKPVLEMLLAASMEVEDAYHMIIALEGLIKFGGDLEAEMGVLWVAYFIAGYPALAMKTYHDFVRNFSGAAEILKSSPFDISEMEEALQEDLKASDLGDDPAVALELSALIDESLLRTKQGRYEEAHAASETVLRRKPGYEPARRNLIQTYFAEGRFDDAAKYCQSILDAEPDNVPMLADLIRIRFIGGDREAAGQLSDDLKARTLDSVGSAVAAMEALSFLGDDAGVLAAYDQQFVRPAKKPTVIIGELSASLSDDEEPYVDPASILLAMGDHLAAVASFRLGKEEEAEALWERALDTNPDLEEAERNLNDLDEPEDMRNGPFAFPINRWIRKEIALELLNIEQPDLENMTAKMADVYEAKMHELCRRILEQFPELLTVLPALLERGDDEGRALAILVATGSESPEMMQALRDFALGRYGTDEARQQAVEFCFENGVIEPGPIRLWIEGEWREAELTDEGDLEWVGE